MYYHGPSVVCNTGLLNSVNVESLPFLWIMSVCVPPQGPTVNPSPMTTGPGQWNGPPPSPVSIFLKMDNLEAVSHWVNVVSWSNFIFILLSRSIYWFKYWLNLSAGHESSVPTPESNLSSCWSSYDALWPASTMEWSTTRPLPSCPCSGMLVFMSQEYHKCHRWHIFDLLGGGVVRDFLHCHREQRCLVRRGKPVSPCMCVCVCV